MEFYRITGLSDITNELIVSLIDRYKTKEVPRLNRLAEYYIGKSDIKKRTMNDPSKPNNKIANPFGAYIVDTVQGYFLGKPVSYQSDNEQLMEKLQLIFDKNHEQAHNSKLGKQLSISGIAYELLYVNEANEIKFSMLDPKEVFMIYDNSIEMKPLAAVRFYDVHNYVTDETVTHVELYTDKIIQHFYRDRDKLTLVEEYPHYFKEVPVICYLNNDEATGDFEKVIDLINAYDLAVSDTANSIEYFSDAYLVLYGMTGTTQEDIAQMKENRVMLMDENGKAEWLIKGTQNMEIEEFKNRLKEDIHTLSAVPNMGDEAFGNATSGESLKYKLFALENSVAIKERNFEKGLENRIKLITNILNIKGGQYIHTDVVMTFQRNLPSNLGQMADVVSKLIGVVSHETILSLLPFIDDPQYEMKRIESEKQDTIDYNFDMDIHTDTSTDNDTDIEEE
ncbi:phage portal protein [Neobacillus sedimentimangrovi]|uniref:Phage portal protein n=1 Tax=Neobacillus sedimentimangrovi TaxID=2699460 RepID=A0ABS8QKC6_9BACI|nr:phage portal protein [Neobacillus sedimentimangrovi]MCD4839739.1 phage portal protein [Neobacillus sedimentimangrovi]